MDNDESQWTRPTEEVTFTSKTEEGTYTFKTTWNPSGNFVATCDQIPGISKRTIGDYDIRPCLRSEIAVREEVINILTKERDAYKHQMNAFEECIENVMYALDQEETHYFVVNGDVRELMEMGRALMLRVGRLERALESLPDPANPYSITHYSYWYSTTRQRMIDTALPVIQKFDGIYAFLSNFYKTSIEYDGLVYPTAEHAFQASKTLNRSEKQVIQNCDMASKAKQAGRYVTLRPDWETVKLDVMEQILRIKFSNHSLGGLLVATGNSQLIEGNHWNDNFWGVDPRSGGENHLGKILMKIREELKKQS